MLVIMPALLKPPMWLVPCSWKEHAEIRLKEGLVDGTADELVANDRASFERSTAEVTLYELPGDWHIEHLS